MAICDGCGQEMFKHVGCDVTWILFDDGRYDRVRYGEEDGDWGAQKGKLCGDCGVPPFTFHHPGCDIEQCPKCGHQQISCWCDDRVWEDEARRRV